MRERVMFRLSVAVLPPSLAYLAWWLIGDQATVAADTEPYPIPWSALSQRQLTVTGWISGALTLAAIGYLIAVLRGRPERREWAVLAATVVITVVLGAAAWRTATARVIGANIGAGMVVLAAPLLVIPAELLISRSIMVINRWTARRSAVVVLMGLLVLMATTAALSLADSHTDVGRGGAFALESLLSPAWLFPWPSVSVQGGTLGSPWFVASLAVGILEHGGALWLWSRARDRAGDAGAAPMATIES